MSKEALKRTQKTPKYTLQRSCKVNPFDDSQSAVGDWITPPTSPMQSTDILGHIEGRSIGGKSSSSIESCERSCWLTPPRLGLEKGANDAYTHLYRDHERQQKAGL